MASQQVSDRSINLKATEAEDNDGGEEDDEEENEMKNLREEHRISSVWKTGGDVKNEVLWKLEKLFSSFVTKLEDEDSNVITYETLLSAHKSVTRATKLLTDSDNYTTRDFTIHIANKKWVSSTLVPLMELGVDDRDLTMRCCRLLMVLTRNLNFDARTFSTLEVKPLKGKETKEEGLVRFKRETISKSNAQQQISAFLSFKEAICTEKCSVAVTNVLYHLWRTEKEERKEREENRLTGNSNDFTKREVATCLSYIRRILQVDAVPSCSSPGEVIMAKSTHNKLVVQLRGALLVVPVICAELADKYNDVWLTDILRIIYFVLRGHDPRDLFKVWKENCLIGEDLNFDKENALPPTQEGLDKKKTVDKKGSIGSKIQTGGLMSFPVPASLAQRAPSLASKGVLGGILGRERAERAKRADEMSRHSRFGGQYRVALGPNPSAPTDSSTDDPPPSSNGSIAKMISRPFSTNFESVPQAKVKRSKKNITFAHVDPYVSVAVTDSMGVDGQRACVVAATLAERICSGMGLKQLVMRVGVDRVREEGIITVDKEIIFFDVLSCLLRYNRLKLSFDKAAHDERASARGQGLLSDFTSETLDPTGLSGGGAWVPNLHNVINALDTMSFRRVFDSLEKLQTTQVKRFSDMVSPLGLYKEMMNYLRLLLESADETHNEFAIARLYSIFYTSSERKDPLPRILAEWSPGTYSRKHLDIVVELVHETLKTLDTATLKYGNPTDDKKKKKAPKGKKAMDLEQYMAGLMNFDVNEYFKRYLATNPTVRMYTRLLSYHATNEPSVNHYAYCYLQRMCSFRLVQDHPAPPRPLRLPAEALAAGPGGDATSSATAVTVVVNDTEPEETLTLGHMLFNIHTLSVFTDLLADTQTMKPKAMEPLVRLIKSVIRRFQKAVHKNHELFSDALFQHAHVQSYIMEIDSVFEANEYAHYRVAGHSSAMQSQREYEEESDDAAPRSPRGGGAERDRETSRGPKADSRPESTRQQQEEEEDEFNEADYSNEERITKKSILASKRREKKEQGKGRNRREQKSSDSDTEGESVEPPAPVHGKKRRVQRGVVRAGATARGSDSEDIQLSNSEAEEQEDSAGHSRNRESEASNGGTQAARNIAPKDGDESDGDDETQSENKKSKKRSSSSSSSTRPVKPSQKTQGRAPTRDQGRDSRKISAKWKAEEDAIVRAQFSVYRGSRSVFDMIAMDPDLMAIGNNRNVLAVGRRVRDLNLTSQMESSDEDEGGAGKSKSSENNAAPIDFGSDSELDAEQSSAGKGKDKSRNQSLDDRIDAYMRSDDEEEQETGMLGSASGRLSSSSRGSDEASRKRKSGTGSDEDSTQSGWRPGAHVTLGDSEATQPQDEGREQGQAQHRLSEGREAERGGKLQRRGGGADSDSDEDLFSGAGSSSPMGTADTQPQGSESDPFRDGSGTYNSDIGAKASVIRSRSMVVDSDED